MNLDPASALIVVDLQIGTTSAPTAHDSTEIIARGAALAAAFRAAGRPVVLANVDGTPPGRNVYGGGAREFPTEFSALVLEAAASDILVTRRTWSAFAGTDLDATLTTAGVTQVVIAGVATSFGVESTARAAYDLGYSVIVVTDAITDRSFESHESSIARVFPALAELATTDEVIAGLV